MKSRLGWLAAGVGLLVMVGEGRPLLAASAGERRPLGIDDYFALGEVGEPALSPDGTLVVFSVERHDLAKDQSETRLFMIPSAGGEAFPLTGAGSSASHPRFSPDGRSLAFLSDRADPAAEAGEEDAKDQVWRFDLRGGDPRRLTEVTQGVGNFEWAPDGRHLVLVIRDPKPSEKEKKEKPEPKRAAEPWVIDRLQFKEDGRGYLDRRRTHLYVLDLAGGEPRQITFGDYDDSQPAWSPAGGEIAFVSNRTEEPDANYNTDLWLVEVSDDTAGKSEPVRLTTNPGSDSSPVWNPSGSLLAYITSTRPEIVDYAQEQIAVIGRAGGEPRQLTASLDRNVAEPRFSPDGRELYFRLEDHGEMQLASVSLQTGEVRRRLTGPSDVFGLEGGAEGRWVLQMSSPMLPTELFVLDPAAGSEPRRLTHVNDAVLAGLRLVDAEKVTVTSADGTPVETFIYRPLDFQADRRYPTLLWLHGGPMAQYSYSFDFKAQLFAAQGYVVVMPNPRGSTGYGIDFTLGIFADWGNHDLQDVLAAVDHAVAAGYADGDRLGVGGWSYGGILTNFVITSTDRFKGAISGAGGGLWVADYGHDHYQRWWEGELGLPWEHRELWERLSSFNKVERIQTPTLWIGGEVDWNVPILNSEQMYQAMRRLGRDTRLVVYPGEDHSIDRPSHVKHMLEQFLGWFGTHVKGQGDAG